MSLMKEVGNVQLMQRMNRLKVLDCIRRKGPMARPEIAELTGLSPSSITNIVSYLINRDLIAEAGIINSKEVGRKAALIKFNPAAFRIVSINIESSMICVALTDLEGNLVEMKELSTGDMHSDSVILKRISDEISAMLKRESAMGPVAGIGIAVSGLVREDGRLVISSSLRWKEISLRQYFSERFGLPVYVKDISRTKALWLLRKGAAARSMEAGSERNVIFLDLAMGIGIVNFLDQRINETMAGEFGHTTVKKDGPLCFCGNRGCLELMCSVETIVGSCGKLLLEGKASVLGRILREKGIGYEGMTPEEAAGAIEYGLVLKAFEEGDGDVRDVLRECGEYLGIALANIINIFNPQRIIINGAVLLTSDFLYETALSEAKNRAYEQFTRNIEYERVDIGQEDAVKGVSLYVADKLFELSGPDFL